MNVAIPSKGRPGRVKTLELVKHEDAILYVEPEEFKAYETAYPKVRIIVLDKSNQGISYVRNAILDTFNEPFIMCDDDITGFFKREKGKLVKCDAYEALKEIMLCLLKGYAQATISFQPSNWMYKNNYKVNTRAWCIVGLNPEKFEGVVRYDERTNYFEDYDFTLQLLNNGLKNVSSFKYAFDCVPMASNKGGLQSFDRIKRSNAALKIFIKKWAGIAYAKFNKKRKVYEPSIQWRVFH